MRGIPPALNKSLQLALLDCGLFWDTRSLRGYFKDARIKAWRHRVPDGNSLAELVNGVIAFLYNKHNTNGENALALFLTVLADDQTADEVTQNELRDLAEQIVAIEKAEQTGGEVTVSERDIKISYTIDRVETFIAGDNYELSGDFSGAIVNIKTSLENTIQTIQTLSTGTETERADFANLVAQLDRVVQDVKLKNHENDLAEIAEKLEEIVADIESGQATVEQIQEKGNKLKQAAENVKEAMPAVVEIAAGIVRAALRVVC